MESSSNTGSESLSRHGDLDSLTTVRTRIQSQRSPVESERGARS